MGLLRPLSGGAFRVGTAGDSFTIASNKVDGSLAFESNVQGIPFTRTDTAFVGTFTNCEKVGGNLQLVQFHGWDDLNAQDELYTLNDMTAWDELAGAETLMNYMLGMVSALLFYEGEGVFESLPYNLGKCRKLHSDVLDFIYNMPANTTVSLELAVAMNGTDFGQWQYSFDGVESTNLKNGDVLEDAKAKYRVKFQTTDLTISPTFSQYQHTLYSYVFMKIQANGDLKIKGAQEQNYSEAI